MSDVTLKDSSTGGRAEATIHDIGYRRYEGKLLGQQGAWRAVFKQGFLAMFGIGRSGKAKVVPIFVLVVTMLPSLGMLTAASATKGMVPVNYVLLIGQQLIMYVLFVAAQAPEVLSRDQQHRLLPLVLTRQVPRTSYALARGASIALSLFIVALAPLLLLYLGEMGNSIDPGKTFETRGHLIWPILGQAAMTSWVIGGVGAALAAWTPRRAYATAAIIGLFLVIAAIATGLNDLVGISPRIAELMDPVRTLRTLAMLLFGETTRGMESNPPLSAWAYAAVLSGVGAAGYFLLHLRIRRVNV